MGTAYDLVASLKQLPDESQTNGSGCTGNEHAHDLSVPVDGWQFGDSTPPARLLSVTAA